MTKARIALREAKLCYKEECYFDCLQKIEQSIEYLNQPVLSALLQATQFNTYYYGVDCYLLSASCYYKMEQYERAV